MGFPFASLRAPAHTLNPSYTLPTGNQTPPSLFRYSPLTLKLKS